MSTVSPVSTVSTPYNRIPGVNGQEMDRKQPESNPVQEALRPTHLSMRRELNCNRGIPISRGAHAVPECGGRAAQSSLLLT